MARASELCRVGVCGWCKGGGEARRLPLRGQLGAFVQAEAHEDHGNMLGLLRQMTSQLTSLLSFLGRNRASISVALSNMPLSDQA